MNKTKQGSLLLHAYWLLNMSPNESIPILWCIECNVLWLFCLCGLGRTYTLSVDEATHRVQEYLERELS